MELYACLPTRVICEDLGTIASALTGFIKFPSSLTGVFIHRLSVRFTSSHKQGFSSQFALTTDARPRDFSHNGALECSFQSGFSSHLERNDVEIGHSSLSNA